ncbi:MmgE/PrpD family protein (plasmid) [Variovorax sp. SRS16]|uniref:MmgE/PrpD family protein n=1 Tax=Variovorax sp. SRS16 TaxID=282217 RepID=UPI0013187741|nr:MmgE/PrpD family protein [Variovorax sp. SRS16]VTU46620.1 MmgE/PrpD family protein [Variovorax sp. SRS16]
MTLAEQFASFADGLRLADVPAPVQRLARLHLIDALGVGLGASAVPSHRRFLQGLREESGTGGRATVLGYSTGASAPVAALLNGTSIHSLEYDDTHMGSIVHGSAVIVPAVLAAVETHALSLDEAVRLVVIGWELLVRLGEASPGGFQRRGFQVTSVGGVGVAALLASVARGASPAQSVAAMGIAGSQAGGIFEFLSNGSNVKALHPGWAAHAGLWAARCAAAGMTGPTTVIEGRYGLFAAYADDPAAGGRLAVGLRDLGTQWRLADAAFKFFPCCHYIHPFLECAQALSARIATVADIAEVHCRVAPGAATVICEPWSSKQQVASGNEAKYSLPYCIARVLLGRPVDIPSMTATSVDADAIALAARIQWTPRDDSGFPAKFDADLRIMLADGTQLHHAVDQVFGSPQRPAGEDAVRAKFAANVAPVLGATARDTAWDAVMQGGSLDTLQRALRTAAD